MVSKIAKEDIEALKEEGIDLTVDEIIRLNAFGLKVERDIDSSELYVLPRVAIVGETSFHEPTIGSEIWLREASRLYNMDDYETFIQIRALSLYMGIEELPNPSNKDEVLGCVSKMLDGLKNNTIEQVMNALTYVIEGNYSLDMEKKAKKKESKKFSDEDECEDDDEIKGDNCFEIGLLNEGILYKLGSSKELKNMTTSRLLQLLKFKKMMKWGMNKKESESKRLGEYYAVLEEIRDNHKVKEDLIRWQRSIQNLGANTHLETR